MMKERFVHFWRVDMVFDICLAFFFIAFLDLIVLPKSPTPTAESCRNEESNTGRGRHVFTRVLNLILIIFFKFLNFVA